MSNVSRADLLREKFPALRALKHRMLTGGYLVSEPDGSTWPIINIQEARAWLASQGVPIEWLDECCRNIQVLETPQDPEWCVAEFEELAQKTLVFDGYKNDRRHTVAWADLGVIGDMRWPLEPTKAKLFRTWVLSRPGVTVYERRAGRPSSRRRKHRKWTRYTSNISGTDRGAQTQSVAFAKGVGMRYSRANPLWEYLRKTRAYSVGRNISLILPAESDR